jgi:hypothetical protein
MVNEIATFSIYGQMPMYVTKPILFHKLITRYHLLLCKNQFLGNELTKGT